MTRKQYRAITTSPAYRDLAIVCTDHTPKHPQLYVTAIMCQVGTDNAPMRAISYVVKDICSRAPKE